MINPAVYTLAASATSAELRPGRDRSLGIVTNLTTGDAYLLLAAGAGATASPTNCTYVLPAGGTLELPAQATRGGGSAVYSGPIQVACATGATGNVVVTEA